MAEAFDREKFSKVSEAISGRMGKAYIQVFAALIARSLMFSPSLIAKLYVLESKASFWKDYALMLPIQLDRLDRRVDSVLRFDTEGRLFMYDPLIYEENQNCICCAEVQVSYEIPSMRNLIDLGRSANVLWPVYDGFMLEYNEWKYEGSFGQLCDFTLELFTKHLAAQALTFRETKEEGKGLARMLRKQICISVATISNSVLAGRKLDGPCRLKADNQDNAKAVDYLLLYSNPELTAGDYETLADRLFELWKSTNMQ